MMPSQQAAPPPEAPAELTIPPASHATVRALDRAAANAWVARQFYEQRAVKAFQSAWFLFRARRAYFQGLNSRVAHEKANEAIWDYLHIILPDTVVGQWHFDIDRMMVTQKRQPQSLMLQLPFGPGAQP